MLHNITHTTKTKYIIKESGKHIFYFENKSGELVFSIENEKAQVFIFGCYEGKNTEKFNLHTLQHHKSPNSESHLLIKGVFQDQSQFNFNVKIKVEKLAQKTKASLKSVNLILSDETKITALPEMEILPQDVKCSHSATISNLNKNQLYFLKSRGIQENKAKELLIEGFLMEIKKITNQNF